MSSTLVLTEAIIDDTDLCLNRLREEILSDPTSSDDNHSDSEMVIAITDNAEELELMKSFGLPIGFTSRSANKRSDKRKKKKKNKSEPQIICSESNDSEDVNQLFEDYWQQCGEQMVENTWMCYLDTEEVGENVPKDSYRTETDDLWIKHWSEVYNESYIKFVEDFDRKSVEKQTLIEDKFEFLPKMFTNFKLNGEYVDGNDVNEDKSSRIQQKRDNRSEPTTSNRSSLLSNTSGCHSGRNDSDSDEPPEERPTRVKREHESDSIDLSEECNQIETEVTPEKVLIKTSRKKKKSKYYHQRYRLFSRFDEGIKLDNESWYSVTPERIAQHIAKRFAQKNYFVIIDAFCGAGGNTIQFASISPFIKVIAIDIDERKIGFAKHNAQIYGVDHRIEFIVADYMLFAKSAALKVDAVFLSPPWGGPKYLKEKTYSLNMMTPNGADVFRVTNAHISPNIGFLLPRNIDTNELRQLAGNPVEVEQNLVNSKVKTVTAYFGDLIQSQSSTD